MTRLSNIEAICCAINDLIKHAKNSTPASVILTARKAVHWLEQNEKAFDKENIIVVLEGGVIQSIDGIPQGVTVEVRDFDIDGTEVDLLQDDDGNSYVEGIWGN